MLRRCLIGTIILLLSLSLWAPAARAGVETDVWINPGIKLTYTFGRGWTWGLELSMVWAPKDWDNMKKMPVAPGMVLSIDSNFDDLTKIHLGAQATELFFGLEMGPSVVFSRGETFMGLAISPWVSSYFIPLYNYTLVFGDTPNLHELGALFKLHLNTGGSFGGSGSFDWDD